MLYCGIGEAMLEPFSFGDLLADTNYVVSQFTGLFDKNGKEIWEGDIVKGNDSWGDPCILQVFYEASLGVANWEPFVFSDECNAGVYSTQVEVIGNRYENPGILAGVKDA